MITKLNKGWRNALMLCAAAAVAVLVSSCRAPAPEAGRYQWVIVPGDEYSRDKIHVIDTATGEMAEWNGSSWYPSYRAPLSTPDWNDIRRQREWNKKRAELEKKQQEEAREKRDALLKSYSQMSLEKQVAWAKGIGIYKISRGRGRGVSNSIDLELYDTLKGSSRGGLDGKRPYKATDDGLVVWFSGTVEGIRLPFEFGLSRIPMEKDHIFTAPATIIDDVKAEIKRQEEKKKAHAENH